MVLSPSLNGTGILVGVAQQGFLASIHAAAFDGKVIFG
jgi:hypothetical protein